MDKKTGEDDENPVIKVLNKCSSRSPIVFNKQTEEMTKMIPKFAGKKQQQAPTVLRSDKMLKKQQQVNTTKATAT